MTVVRRSGNYGRSVRHVQVDIQVSAEKLHAVEKLLNILHKANIKKVALFKPLQPGSAKTRKYG